MKKSSVRVIDMLSNYRENLKNLYSPNEIRHIVYLLFESSLGWPKTKVHLSYDESLSGESAKWFEQSLAQLKSGTPIQYIIGETWFNGARLKVDKRVLIPRPETEELCALIRIDFAEISSGNFEFLDIGTGSGCIAIDLKRRFPDAQVTAIDISPDALMLAEENARSLRCDIKFNLVDILRLSDQRSLGKFDLIVSNPPYVTESEKKNLPLNVSGFEPPTALYVPDDDPIIFYRAISTFAKEHLNGLGRLYFEINEKFGDEIQNNLIKTGFIEVEVFRDLNGKSRFVRAISGDF
jgi:release factor glutamine methyltransferase